MVKGSDIRYRYTMKMLWWRHCNQYLNEDPFKSPQTKSTKHGFRQGKDRRYENSKFVGQEPLWRSDQDIRHFLVCSSHIMLHIDGLDTRKYPSMKTRSAERPQTGRHKRPSLRWSRVTEVGGFNLNLWFENICLWSEHSGGADWDLDCIVCI